MVWRRSVCCAWSLSLASTACAPEEDDSSCSRPPSDGCQDDNPPYLRLIGGGSSCVAIDLNCEEGELEYEDACGCGCYTSQWCYY